MVGRRTSPLTLVITGLVSIALLFYYLRPSHSGSAPTAGSQFSPPTSPFRRSDKPPEVVHYHLNNVTATGDPVGNKETILILTPMARFYQGYWDNLLSLSYPHDLISVGFIIPKNRDGNAATQALQEQIKKTQSSKRRFKSITILRQDFEPPTGQSESERHKLENQKARRASMSKARNSLLFTTLGPATSWVLWLDSDIIESPPSLIQDLASHNKPIIVPNCFQRYKDPKTGEKAVRPYDFNSWVDSTIAQDLANQMGPDDILLEGYSEMATYRTLMAYLKDDAGSDKVMQLDGVGGTALLVKAEVHRDGAMFPPFAFYHLIETEGFAKMAKRLGWGSWGLPNYFVS
jgi:mannan polymerase complexes MNN9 subunit